MAEQSFEDFLADSAKRDAENSDPFIRAINEGEKYKPEEGWLDTALGALDYAGNVSRSAILGASRGGLEGGWEYAKQAANKERFTSSTQIKDLALGGYRFAPDDGKFQWGDVGDVALDLVFDIATDPVTYASFGWGALAKNIGGKSVKDGGKIAFKHLDDFRKANKKADELYNVALKDGPGEALFQGRKSAKNVLDPGDMENIIHHAKGVKRYQQAELAARAGLGGLYGLGTSGEDDDFFDKLVNFGVGATAVGAGTKFAPTVGKYVGKRMDEFVDAYATGSRGKDFKGLGEAFRTLSSASNKLTQWNNFIRQGRHDALKELSIGDRVEASKFMQNAQLHIIERRQKDHLLKKLDKGTPEYYKRMSEVDEVSIWQIEKDGGLLDQYTASRGDQVRKGILNLAQMNDEIVDSMKWANPEQAGDLQKIRYYSPAMWPVDEVAERSKMADTAMKGINAEFDVKWRDNKIDTAMSKERFAAQEELAKKYQDRGMDPLEAQDKAFKDVFDNYAEKHAAKFLTDEEFKAKQMVDMYKNMGPEAKGVQMYEKGLEYFDKLNNFMKGNMLMFSMSWLVNNFWDNSAKSFVEHGLGGIFDSATVNKIYKGLDTDMLKIANGEFVADVSDNLKVARDLGVIDTNMFQSVMDKDMRNMMKSRKTIAQEMKSEEAWKRLGKFEKTGRKGYEVAKGIGEKWEKLLNKTTGNVGTYMETAARMATFNRTKRGLMNSGLSKDAINEIAAKHTIDTFFDYGKVSHFERAVFKRIFPFYSFYSKNLPHWMGAIFDPSRAGRVQMLEKLRSNIGEDPHPRVREGLTNYLRAAAPRYLGKEGGDYKLAVMPSMSIHDAIMMIDPSLSNVKHQFVEKSNPYFKVPVEALTGKDFFTGQALLPSQSGKGENYLFSRGYKWHFANKALEALGLGGEDAWIDVTKAYGGDGVYVDKKGRPKSISDLNVVVDKLLGTVVPMPLVDQLVGSIGKTIYDRSTAEREFLNRMLPMQQIEQDTRYARMIAGGVRKRKKNQEKMEKKREANRREARARANESFKE